MSVNQTACGTIKWDDPVDDSQIFRCSMRSSTDIAAASGVLQAGATIDPIKGVKNSPSSPVGCVQFDLSVAIADAIRRENLNETCQVSFEVEWAAITGSNNVGNGYDRAGQEFHWQINDTDSVATPYMSLYSAGAIGATYTAALTSDTNPPTTINDAVTRVNGDFAQYVVSVDGQTAEIIVNDVLMNTVVRNSAHSTGEFAYMMIGALLTSNLANTSGSYYRNVIISSRPASYCYIPGYSRIVWVGDSFVSQAVQVGNVAPYGGGCNQAVNQRLRSMGIASDSDVSVGVAGATIRTTGVNDIADQLAAAIALSDGILCYRGGTNDVISSTFQANKAQIEIDLQSQMTTALASVDYVVIGDVPSVQNSSTYADSQYRTNVDDMNNIINGLVSWWDAANPSDTGRIVVAKQFNAFGGHSPDAGLFQPNNYHPSKITTPGYSQCGQWLQGRVFADEIVKLLGV